MTRRPTILRHISILYRHSQIHMNRSLRGLGLGAGPYPFLLAVNRRPGMSQDELAEDLAMDRGTTARAVRDLEKAGYLVRSGDPRDRRVQRLSVTESGTGMVELLDELLRSWMEVLFSGFTDPERAAARDLVERMSENARTRLSGESGPSLRASSRP